MARTLIKSPASAKRGEVIEIHTTIGRGQHGAKGTDRHVVLLHTNEGQLIVSGH